MTEYGRGPGSEPWHPEDPLYGDDGMGRTAGPGPAQSPTAASRSTIPASSRSSRVRRLEPQQASRPGAHIGTSSSTTQGQQQYGASSSHDAAAVPAGQQQHGQGQQYGQPTRPAAPTTRAAGRAPAPHAHVPYAAASTPVIPTASRPRPYGASSPTSTARPTPIRRRSRPAAGSAEPERRQTDWDPGPDQGEHAFFAGGDDDDEDDDDEDDAAAAAADAAAKAPEARAEEEPQRLRLPGRHCWSSAAASAESATSATSSTRIVSARRRTTRATARATVTVEIPKGAGGSRSARS